jgi:hypothetical protein
MRTLRQSHKDEIEHLTAMHTDMRSDLAAEATAAAAAAAAAARKSQASHEEETARMSAMHAQETLSIRTELTRCEADVRRQSAEKKTQQEEQEQQEEWSQERGSLERQLIGLRQAMADASIESASSIRAAENARAMADKVWCCYMVWYGQQTT